MAAGPQRRPEPVRHLLAHIVPVEKALHERADQLLKEADDLPDDSIPAAIKLTVAAEFRKLAAELHHW